MKTLHWKTITKELEMLLISPFLMSFLKLKGLIQQFGVGKVPTIYKKKKVKINVCLTQNRLILVTNTFSPAGTLKNPNCLSLLSTVEETIKKWELDSVNSSNLLRITISSFGSPFWQFDENQNSVSTDFTATLLLLKSIVRSANAVAVVTIPHQLLSVRPLRMFIPYHFTVSIVDIFIFQQALVSRSRKLADVVIQLKSLREDPHLRDLMDVHGILEMKKIMNLTSLKPIQDGTTTYGFKATKRKFKIEVRYQQRDLLDLIADYLLTVTKLQKLHLPPAVEDDKSAADNSSSMGCSSGSSKSNLDF